MNVTLADFCPINPWIPRNNDLIDYFTGRAYSLEPKVLVGFKCFLLTIGTIPVHLLAATKADIAGLGRILSFYHLNTRPPMDFWTRFKVAIGLIDPPLSRWNWMVRQNTKELGRILLSPITIVGLELSAMYGVV
jgi:hypothetical protein